MNIEIFETYPAQIISHTFSSISLPVSMSKGNSKINEHIKILLESGNEGESLVKIIESFFSFCESTLSPYASENSNPFEVNIKGLEENCFVRTTFKVNPVKMKITTDKDNVNKLNVTFSHPSSSVTDKKMNIDISTVYFIFSCLINLRNFFEYNTYSFHSPIKKLSVLKFRGRIDKIFDELIKSNIKGNFETRFGRTSDCSNIELQTIISAIEKSGKRYSVKEYSLFTVEEHPFMLLEHNNNEEILLFEYKYLSKIFEVNL